MLISRHSLHKPAERSIYELLIIDCQLCAPSNSAGRLISHMALSPDLCPATGVTLCPRYLRSPRMQRARKARKLSHMARRAAGPKQWGQLANLCAETRNPAVETLETRRGWCRLARALPHRPHAIRIRSLTSWHTVMRGVGGRAYLRAGYTAALCVGGEYQGTHLLISLCST